VPSFHPTTNARPFSHWLKVVAASLWLVATLAGTITGRLTGQQSSQSPGAKKLVSAQLGAVPSLASMEQALLHQDYAVDQLRRFRDELGNVVTVRERLHVDANGTTRPDFKLTFLGVEGEPAGSPLTLEWQQAYSRFGSLFFRHGSFQVRDVVKAASNYTLHDFGPVLQAGRLARRVVVFPSSMDKAIWVLDVDCATSVPLLVAEFDRNLQVCANIEAISFSPVAQSFAPVQYASSVTTLTSFAAAQARLGSPSGLVNPNVMVTPDYSIDSIELYVDPINGREKLVMSYCDGIDQFMVTQVVNSLDPFAGLPSSAGGGHTIGRFRDPAVSALVFWEDQVAFQIAGRGSLKRLDEVARRIYLQALSQ
jgi:hypothetical protein